MKRLFVDYSIYDNKLAKIYQRSSDDTERPDGIDIFYGGPDGDGPSCGYVGLDKHGTLVEWISPKDKFV